jgi:hypothetical protein
MLLWGASVPPTTKAGDALLAKLVAASDSSGEHKRFRTEPDVVIDAGDAGVVFIEVKLHSGNEVQSDEKRFERYLRKAAFTDRDAIISSGYYELVRNWSLGTAVAGDRPFYLINLGPNAIFDDPKHQNRWAAFASGIGDQPHRSFHKARWPDVLATLSDSSTSWIHDYVQQRLTKGARNERY